VATPKTRLTELATAVGLVYEPSRAGPLELDPIEVPGLDRSIWQPSLQPATEVGSPQRELLLRALDNGRAFRTQVLGGRRPRQVDWLGGSRATWTSDIPRDITVDGVWFIQAKYDSTCVLNTAPSSLVDELLADHAPDARHSWYEEVALAPLQHYYQRVRQAHGTPGLTDDVRDLDRAAKDHLKSAMRGAPSSPPENEAYAELCRAVSIETTLRWRHRLDASTPTQVTQMLFRMLRIAGGPYWLLGTKGSSPVRLAVTDTHTWRQAYELRSFRVLDAHAGQPQVDWRAEIVERGARERRHHVEGFCELRWSHGKLQGHPECKVQVTTPLADIPGYRPMADG